VTVRWTPPAGSESRRAGGPHSADLRKGRHSAPGLLYFVTKHTEQGRQLELPVRDALAEALQHGRRTGWFRLHAFVVMPDHWHALWSLGERLPLAGAVAAVGRRASYGARSLGRTVAWQAGFYDHFVRPEERVADIVAYIEGNPVRGGWVPVAEEWPWSSAHEAYRGGLDRDSLGPERW
jgi:putative transposase